MKIPCIEPTSRQPQMAGRLKDRQIPQYLNLVNKGLKKLEMIYGSPEAVQQFMESSRKKGLQKLFPKFQKSYSQP